MVKLLNHSMLVSSSIISGKYLAFMVVNFCKVYVKWLGHMRLVPIQVMVEVVLLIVWCTFLLVVNRSLGWVMTYSLLSIHPVRYSLFNKVFILLFLEKIDRKSDHISIGFHKRFKISPCEAKNINQYVT